jgi:hypothetical protein
MTGGRMQAATDDSATLPEGEALVLNEWEQSFLFLFALVLGLIGLVMLFSSVQHHLHGAARPVAGLWSIAAVHVLNDE